MFEMRAACRFAERIPAPRRPAERPLGMAFREQESFFADEDRIVRLAAAMAVGFDALQR